VKRKKRGGGERGGGKRYRPRSWFFRAPLKAPPSQSYLSQKKKRRGREKRGKRGKKRKKQDPLEGQEPLPMFRRGFREKEGGDDRKGRKEKGGGYKTDGGSLRAVLDLYAR